MGDYTALLREFGFPIVVALWFMLRAEKRLDRLAELVAAHMQATALIAKSLEDHRPFLRVVPAPKEGEGDAS